MHLARCFERLILADASLCHAFPPDAVDALKRLIRHGRNPAKRQVYCFDARHPLPPDVYRKAIRRDVMIMRADVRRLTLFSAMASFRSKQQLKWGFEKDVDPNAMATLGGTIFRLNTIFTEVNENYYLPTPVSGNAETGRQTEIILRLSACLRLSETEIIANCTKRVLKISKGWQGFSSYQAAEFVDEPCQWPISSMPFVMKDVLKACTAVETLYRMLPEDKNWSPTSGPPQQVCPRKSVDIEYMNMPKGDSEGCRSDMRILAKVLRIYIDIKL